MSNWTTYHRSSGASGHERIIGPYHAEVTLSQPGKYIWLVIERPITNGSLYKRGYAKKLTTAKSSADRVLMKTAGIPASRRR